MTMQFRQVQVEGDSRVEGTCGNANGDHLVQSTAGLDTAE